MMCLGFDTTILCEILSLAPFIMGPDLFSGESAGFSIGPTIAAVDNNAALLTGTTLNMEQADKTHSGIVTAVAQDIGGSKTFWANTQVIPENSFVVAPGENPNILDLVVQTQEPFGGVQVQTDNPTNTMGYAFGTVNNDA